MVAKCRSFTEAASKLYVSLPNVSKQISLLENELGVQLFVRKPFIQLTEEGTIMLEAFSQMDHLLKQSLERLERLRKSRRQNLRIGFLQCVDVSEVIGPAMQKFRECYPNAGLSIDCSNHIYLNAALSQGDIDIGITLDANVHIDGMAHMDICQYNYAIVLHSNHRLAKQEAGHIDIKELRSEQFLVVGINGVDEIVANYIAFLCAKFGITSEQIKCVPDVETLLLNVEIGLGVALLSKMPRFIHNPSVKCIPLEDAMVKVRAVWKKDNPNLLIPVFTRFLVEKANLFTSEHEHSLDSNPC
jgi:DNA-binding transcriptional LysR family regulator